MNYKSHALKCSEDYSNERQEFKNIKADKIKNKIHEKRKEHFKVTSDF